METDLTLSPFQTRVLTLPEEFDVFLGGGRGGAKSYTLALLILRHAEQHRERARVLYIRRSYRGAADFEDIARELFAAAYGPSVRFNAAEHVWRLPGGAYVELGQLDAPGDYAKYQGRSFTLLLVDEAGQYATPELLDRLRSNLRGPRGVPIRTVLAANPGDAGHAWLSERFVFRAAPWEPFEEPRSGRTWVYAPSTYRDNPFIDQATYAAQLGASCPADPELLRAWLDGDWAVARGAFFAGVLSEERTAMASWEPPLPEAWARDAYLAHDFGTAAPSVTYVVAKSSGAEGPDGRWYPRDSVLLLDELATSDPADPGKGLGWTVPRLAEEIRGLAGRWGIAARGAADDAIFAKSGHAAGSIADEFSRCGVHFDRARKGERRHGWEKMRRMLEAAAQPDAPGLYVSRRCGYFWQTVPYLPRDPRRVDDVDSRAPDHAADAARYALTGEPLGLTAEMLYGANGLYRRAGA